MSNSNRLADPNSSPSRTEYVPLMTLEDADEEGKADNVYPMNMTRDRHGHGLSAFTSAAIWAALLVSIVAFLASATSFLRVVSVPHDGYGGTMKGLAGVQATNLGLLRHPSLYLGLERAPEIKVRLRAERILAALNPSMPTHGDTSHSGHGSGHESGTIHGAQGSDNNYAFPTRARRVNSLYPNDPVREDGWVLVNDWDTTFLQFILLQTNKGTKLEHQRCTFVATFPARSGLDGRLLTIEGAPNITVYHITNGDETEMANVRMTWNNRPSSGLQLGNVGVKLGGRSETESFDCEPGATIVLELRCAKNVNNCRVEYEMDESSATLGFSLLIDNA